MYWTSVIHRFHNTICDSFPFLLWCWHSASKNHIGLKSWSSNVKLLSTTEAKYIDCCALCCTYNSRGSVRAFITVIGNLDMHATTLFYFIPWLSFVAITILFERCRLVHERSRLCYVDLPLPQHLESCSACRNVPLLPFALKLEALNAMYTVPSSWWS